jgi:hypothetical protein
VFHPLLFINDELRKPWNEVVMAYFKVLSYTLPGGTNEKQNKAQLGSQDLNLRLPAGV